MERLPDPEPPPDAVTTENVGAHPGDYCPRCGRPTSLERVCTCSDERTPDDE